MLDKVIYLLNCKGPFGFTHFWFWAYATK